MTTGQLSLRICTTLAAAAVLAGCASNATSGKPPVRPPASVATFLRVVVPLWPATNTPTDLIRLAKGECSALRAGTTYGEIVDRLHPYGRRAVVSLDAAMATFCPEQRRG